MDFGKGRKGAQKTRTFALPCSANVWNRIHWASRVAQTLCRLKSAALNMVNVHFLDMQGTGVRYPYPVWA